MNLKKPYLTPIIGAASATSSTLADRWLCFICGQPFNGELALFIAATVCAITSIGFFIWSVDP